MNRPIYTETRTKVNKRGILQGAEGTRRNITKVFFDEFLNGQYALKYMKGEAHGGDWIGRSVHSQHIAKSDDGASFLISVLLKEIDAVRSEKGFRFSGSLLTPKEHRECGSSGYGLFAGPNHEYDNMPVPLANLILKLEDKEMVTVEQIRIARELDGKPTIDERGFVTGERIKRDSYHFLQPDALERVKQREIEIASALEILSAHLGAALKSGLDRFVQALRQYIRNVGEGEKRLSTKDLEAMMPVVIDAQRGENVDFSGFVQGAKAVAFALGYRDGILSPQEIIIAGRKADSGLDPHIPVGIQTGKVRKELAAKRRAEENSFPVYTELFTDYGMPFVISLEPLLEDGATARGPRLINVQTGLPSEESMSHFKDKCDKIPFARPGDWFFKG